MRNSSSEDSSDDEMPIQSLAKSKAIWSKQHGVSSAKKELMRDMKEDCEFCEKICNNKYEIFVHNASHIIVPLKHNIPHCKQCNMLFESPAKLNAHNEKKHLIVPDILKNMVQNEPIIKVHRSMTDLKDEAVAKTDQIEYSDTFVSKKAPELSQFMNKFPIIRCEDTVTRLIIGGDAGNKFIGTDANAKRNNVAVNQNLLTNLDSDKVERINKPDMKQSLDFTSKVPSIECDDVVKRLFIEDSQCDQGKSGNTEENVINIKSKIVFEDEMEDDDEDIITFNEDQQVIDLIDPDSDDNEEYKKNEIILGSKPNGVTNANIKSQTFGPIYEGTFTPAVHYDELMQFGLFCCKFCDKSFPNKYQKILHEVEHIKINPRPKTLYLKCRVCRFCDQYIAGNHWNLKRHHSKYHADYDEKYQTTHKFCPKCNLRYYSYGRHFFKYHLLYTCQRCSKPFESESALNCHSSKCNGVKYVHSEPRVGELRTTKVCNVCALFNLNNNRFKQQYKVVGNYSEKGKRVQCEACSKEFFEVNLLSYISYHKNWQYHTKTRVPLTNETRLKNINQRLKKMKMLSRT